MALHSATTDSQNRPLRAVVVNWRDLGHRLAGGSERYAWESARALRDAGVAVEFITARDRGQSRSEEVEGIGIRRGGGAFGFYLFAAWSLLTRRRRLDVVIDPECGIPAFSPLFVRRTTAVVLVVHHVHQKQFGTYFPAPVAAFGRWLERVAMRRVYRGRRTVAVSESTRREMQGQLGWTGEIELLANGADVPSTSTGPIARSTSADRLVVLGRLVPHKRVDLVLRAVRDLAAERPDLQLDVCGKGPEQERLEQLAATWGIADRVRFHGYVEDAELAEILSRATLHVCASDVEGWGQVVIDVAAHGVPTVARDVPGLRDSIRDGETGFLTPDDVDPERTAERVTAAIGSALTTLESAPRRREIAAACRRWAQGFSWARMHAETVALVADELVRRRGADVHPGARPRHRDHGVAVATTDRSGDGEQMLAVSPVACPTTRPSTPSSTTCAA
ncbi:glycosyltransferase family 4 protein [Nocardioides sp. R-C-SC26]|uniref:glycosyltransferase family 4 protein n=1 Tax=Nocardioides sp. R-C-SC26 TaxID=2870414 RepID=UPI001E3C399A|nr:glycosyltransferase family 4 protein [Nocardioides sp. R-C-SC26]